VFTGISDAIEAKPDAAIISVPTAFHVDYALDLARAGCHLFIEKPLSNSMEGVLELERLARKNNLIVLMGYDLHFDPGLVKAKALLEQNAIGHVVSIQAQVGQYLPDWHPWEDYRDSVSAKVETGGGVVLDLSHELDYVTWLKGESPTAVAAFCGKLSDLEIETEDIAAILLQFGTDAIGSVHMDYIQRVASRTCRIIGEEGTIEWDYFGNTLRWYLAKDQEWQQFHYPEYSRSDRFRDEMVHFLSCLEGREEPKSNLQDGIRTLRLALAVKKAASGEKVIAV
jgi:predicted dehydrogenase